MKLTRTSSGFLPCREILEFLHAYLDDDLEAEERREFDRHLALCPSCVAYLDTFRTTVELGRHAFDEGGAASPALDAPPPPLPEDLVAAILAIRG